MSEATWSNAVVTRRHDVNARVALFWIRPDSGDVGAFVPGQFVQLGLPSEVSPSVASTTPDAPPARVRMVKRSYSIASAPNERDAYELCIAFVDEGKLTPRLRGLRVGDRLWCDAAPKGFFTLARIPDGRDLVTIATGTGIAPFVSMWRHHGAEAGRFRRFVAIHGARERSDLAYDQELTAAQRHDPRVRYVPVLSREPGAGDWHGLRGRVQTALEEATFREHAGFELRPEGTHVLLCGNPQMIDDVRALLETRGFTVDTPKVPGNVHFERYW